ncbi:MAG: phenylalanine--tRNA ligase subunit beta [Mycoplasma sp.]
MLVSKKILSSFNPIFNKLSNADFTSLCNRVGIEVEQILTHFEMENLQIAYIEEVDQHPNADKLNVAKVRLSKDKVVMVVCGAANIKSKMYAIYAPIGTKFLDGRVIEEKTIRGVESCGMLCGFQELTIIGIENMHDDDADGIVLFNKGKIGDTNIFKYISNDDVIYDLSIPSNRSDLNAVTLLVNELCFGLQIENTVDLDLSNSYKKPLFDFKLNNNLASDFSLIYVPSLPCYEPNWHEKQVLMSCGYKIHNNILDLMNLFTISFGNPIHIYDASNIDIKKMTIKQTPKESDFLALDGKTYKVPEKSIGIYHGSELINIAGIIGSDKSKFNESQSVIIEVANFNPELVRKTAIAMKVQTKAQAFFSKPFSSWITQHTFNSICDHLKAQNIKFKYIHNFQKIKSNVITYKTEEMLKFIGVDKVDFKKNAYLTKDKYYVHPSRIDIQNEYDVYEEIMKIVDINKLVPRSPEFSVNLLENSNKFSKQNNLKQYLISNNMFEVKTYNLSSIEEYKMFNFFNVNHEVKIANPISKKREVLRHSLFDEMLKTIQYNMNRKRDLQNIFEIQPITVSDNEIFNNLSMVFVKPLISEKITNSNTIVDLITLKSFIKNMALSVNVNVSFELTSSTVSEVYPNQVIAIKISDEIIGYIARVKSSSLKKYDIQKDVYIVSLNIDKIINHTPIIKLNRISEFPTVSRDFNVEIENKIDINKMIDSICQINYVTKCWVKDLFKDGDKTTYTLSVKMSNLDATLSTIEIDKIMCEISKIAK